MTVRRLVTYADVAPIASEPVERVSVRVRQELELADGRSVLLLNDRGWGSTGSWSEISERDIHRAVRLVVGTDEPTDGRSHEDMADLHWNSLREIAQQQGIGVDAQELRRLPHEIVISPLLLALIDGGSTSE